MWTAFFEGMLLQASLIFALGPQNIFILESGIRRKHHIAVSFVCFFCDLAIIMLGVAGAGSLFTQHPQIKITFGVLGVVFLLLYGFGKIRTSDEFTISSEQLDKYSLKKSVFKAVTFSVVNPHAYLDGVVLIGGFSAKYLLLEQRLMLGMGAACYSLIWFLTLSLGASALLPLFKSTRMLKLVLGSAGVILLFLSAKLSMDVYSWIIEVYPSLAIRN